MNERPKRRMPTLKAIHKYWWPRPESWDCFRQEDEAWPTCYGCQNDDWSYTGRDDCCLVRAHLIDRAKHGLDLESNLVPLCEWCHAVMPSFKPGDERRVIAWIRALESWDERLIRVTQQFIMANGGIEAAYEAIR